MRTATQLRQGRTAPERARERARDAKLLRESGAHKLVFTDRDGHCVAYLLAWDSFGYDPDTDTFVCCVDRDGHELMNIYTEGEVKVQPGTDTYVVTVPDVESTIDEAS